MILDWKFLFDHPVENLCVPTASQVPFLRAFQDVGFPFKDDV